MADSIWTEKYRPREFGDISGQIEIVSKAQAFVKQKNMPHLLFSGPAGVGKSTLALVIGRQLFGDTFQSNFLELNASDERGIDVVRSKVKDFARTRSIGEVPFKIIFLDECDALTKEAQQALRRTMENYTQTCRFILSCNYSSKIIDPIQSRCAVFRFKPLVEEEIYGIIDRIAKAEGIKVDKDAKRALYEISGGDCRRVENILQSSAVVADKITAQVIYSMASYAQPEDVSKILSLAYSGKFLDARKLLLDVMLKFGLSGLDMVQQIQKHLATQDMPEKQKMILIDKCGEAEFRMTEGSDEYLQLEAFLSQVTLAGISKN